MRSYLSLLGSLQEILSRNRLPGGPLQSPIQLLGQSQVDLRLCDLLLLVVVVQA